MSELEEHLGRADTVIAVVGATDTRGKYGGIIYRDLKRKGFTVRAINPNRATVDGDPSFPDLGSVPGPIDIVDVVVPPEVGHQAVSDAATLEVDHVWLQPGAESDELINEARSLGLEITHHDCIMVRTSEVS